VQHVSQTGSGRNRTLSTPTPAIVLGAMTFGDQMDASVAAGAVDRFLSAGGRQVDTAHVYTSGASERILGDILSDYGRDRFEVATKVNPFVGGERVSLLASEVERQLTSSLDRLRLEHVDLLYLHTPDNDTPLEETLEACARLHEAGAFDRLGLSNYASWQVVDAWHLCDRAGWPKPVVYQGMYNAVTREVESELIPSLRHLGIAFYAYNPLAGGLLTGKHRSFESEPPSGRFRDNPLYAPRFWKRSYFTALEAIREACTATKVSMAAAALRWMVHHSRLAGRPDDAVIVGASALSQLEQNLAALADGPLDESVVRALDGAWEVVRPDCPRYWRD
jgi:aflatoxin B1 aldehyde reductase